MPWVGIVSSGVSKAISTRGESSLGDFGTGRTASDRLVCELVQVFVHDIVCRTDTS
jgi:hypothetical protein